ncbi:MAG: DNA gyrase C-terminal beta-propeller domain-containing protein, partial [Bacteroidia bacterium]
INITEKTGELIAIKNVTDDDDLMIINKSGIVLRMAIKDIRVMGRNTQGVRLINLKNGDSIAAVTVVPKDEEEEVVKPDGEILEGTVDNGTDFEQENNTNEESSEEKN